jgi:hypothetical protein
MEYGDCMNATEQIDQQIAELTDWRGPLYAHLRSVIHEADPGAVEEWKWGTGIYSDGGMVCAIAAFKDHVKVNFFQGADLQDPSGLFNAGLDAKKTRAIDIYEGGSVNEQALGELVRSAVAFNKAKAKPR